MPKIFNGYKMLIIFPISGEADWTPSKIREWIVNAGGAMVSKFEDGVTHVICSKEAFEEPNEDVKAAIAARESGQDIKIAEDQWLIDSLMETKKFRINKYLWLPKVAKKPSNSIMISTAEILHDYTKNFVDERTLKRMAMEEEDQQIKERKLKQEKAFRKAMTKRVTRDQRVQFFAENNHIYRDADGVFYNIVLRKVERVEDEDERDEHLEVSLQIYESNEEPHLYTMNSHSAPTARRRQKHMISAKDVNLPTAMHCFKTIFEELTTKEWDTVRSLDNEASSETVDQADPFAIYRQEHFVYCPGLGEHVPSLRNLDKGIKKHSKTDGDGAAEDDDRANGEKACDEACELDS